MRKLTLEDVKSRLAAKGWDLKDDVYLGSQIPMGVICPSGHSTAISWNNFQKGQGCQYCAGNAQYGIEQVREAFKQEGCKLLSEEYLNNHENLRYKCSCGMESKVCFRDFLRGVRCASCKATKLSEIKRITPGQVEAFCVKHNLVFLKLWVEGKKTKVDIRCQCGKNRTLFWNQLRANPSCRHLEGSIPKVGRRKNITGPKRAYELWKETWEIPNSTILLVDPKNCTKRGSLSRLVRNIAEERYLVAFIHEWHNRQEQWVNHLSSMCGVYHSRVFARKCEVREVGKQEVREFCDQYHIQGKNNLSIQAWGLFYEDELLGIISLGRHHRNLNDLILDRLCFKTGVQVVGGANKLFRRCISWAKEQGHGSIVSFSDNRYSRGDVYGTLGFRLDCEMPPDYFYVLQSDPIQHFSKQSQRKKCAKCPEGMTEHEWAVERGLLRVWDCGKKRWIYDIKEGN